MRREDICSSQTWTQKMCLVIDTAEFKEVKRLEAGRSPFGLAFSPDRRFVYVSNQLSVARPISHAAGPRTYGHRCKRAGWSPGGRQLFSAAIATEARRISRQSFRGGSARIAQKPSARNSGVPGMDGHSRVCHCRSRAAGASGLSPSRRSEPLLCRSVRRRVLAGRPAALHLFQRSEHAYR